jgi:hypothetical protein
MFITLQETVQETDEVAVLLAGMGFDGDVETELAIDEFDQWTNPRDAALIPSSGIYTGDELERVA